MADRYAVLPASAIGTEFADLDAAEANASGIVDKERGVRLVVKVVSVIRPRTAPNVDVERVEENGHV